MKQHVFIQPGSTFRIRYMMEALKPGDTQDPRPVAPPRPPQPSAAAQTAAPQAGARSEFGSVAIRVQPRDAQVFIDGQRWEAPVDNERLVVQLPAGEHRVEIRKDGFGQYSSTIDIRRGNETTLNVSLTRE